MKYKLIDCCLDYFVEEVGEDKYINFEEIKVDEEEYVKQKFPTFFDCLLEIENSQEEVSELEKFLITKLSLGWKSFRHIWQAYKDFSISRCEMFHDGFKIFGERKLIGAFHEYPTIKKCVELKIKE